MQGKLAPGQWVMAEYRGQWIDVQLLRRRWLWWRIYVLTSPDHYFLGWVRASKIVQVGTGKN